jgi:5'-3' exonuclease
MGIKNYLGSLSEQFPEVLQATPPPTIDVLCIDLNAALHPICAHSSNQDEFQRNLCGYLDRLLRKRKPRRIAVFVDGQAVLAKASIQRKRRQKHLYEADDHRAISTLCITPGTPFMHFIEHFSTFCSPNRVLKPLKSA